MKIVNLAISDIVKYTGNGCIYFWGAGKAFDDYIPKLLKFVDLSSLKGIVDKKQIGFRTIGETKIPLITCERFLQVVKNEDLLIITTKYYKEIIDALRGYDKQDIVRVCIYSFTLLEQLDREDFEKKVPVSFRTSPVQLIPKKIHYCWFGGNPIPEQYTIWMKSWQKYCPDYEIKEWNESNYDIHKNKFIEQAYQSKKWAFVADYVRLDTIYNYGGVYLDTDVELLKNIDDFLYNKAFCGFESSEYVAFGLGYGSVAHNDIVKEMMQYYENRPFLNSEGKMDLTTCPVVQTNVLEMHGLKRNGDYQVIEGMAVYPKKVMCPFSTRTCRLTKNLSDSYMVHHFAASWNPEFSQIMEERKKFNELFVEEYLDT